MLADWIRTSIVNTAGAAASQRLRRFCLSFRSGRLLKLAVIEVGIEAACGQQAFVRALLDDIAVLHHEDEVRVFDRREAVGNDEARGNIS